MNWKFKIPRKVLQLKLCLLGIEILSCFSFYPKLLALDPHLSVSQFRCRTWDQDSGLPTAAIHTLCQANDGKLWLGTAQGLLYFDGIEFHEITPPTASSFEGKIISEIIPLGNHGVLFATEGGGIGTCEGTEIKEMNVGSGELDSVSVHTMTRLNDGSILLGSVLGLHRWYVDGKLECLLALPYLDVVTVYATDDGKAWIGTVSHGIFFFDGREVVPVDIPELKQTINHTLLVDARGWLWAGTQDGLYVYTEQRSPVTIPSLGSEVKKLSEDRDGNIWIGTQGEGLFRYREGVFDNLRASEGLGDDNVLELIESDNGILWIGTRDGLSQLFQYKFPTYSQEDGLQSSSCIVVAENPAGGVWVGTTDGIALFNEGEFTTYSAETTPYRSAWIKYVYPCKNGDIYLQGSEKNVDLFRDGKILKSWEFDIWPNELTEDEKGPIFALGGELKRIEGEEVKPYLLKNGEEVDLHWITSLLVSEKNHLWIGASYGLYEINNGELIDHFLRNGTPAMRCSEIAIGKNGSIWIAGRDGMAWLNEGVIHIVDHRYQLPKYFINTIVPDELGFLWLDTNQGIIRVSEQALIDAALGVVETLDFQVYRGRVAMKTTDKIAYEHSGCRTKDGKIWFPSAQGLIVIDPGNLPDFHASLAVEIRDVFVNGEPYLPDDGNKIEPGKTNLQFDYYALDYLAPNEIRYRYKMLGFDDDWVYASNRRSAFYTNLGHGSYGFVVQAKYEDGDWNADVASIQIEIPPRFYQRPIYQIVFVFAVVIFAFYLIWSYNLRKEQKHFLKARALLEANVKERTHELAATNEALLLEIEERKRAKERVERLNEEMTLVAQKAQQAAVAKSQFLANMSHELRTPMNAILGMNELLLETELDDDQQEFAEISKNGTRALLTIINDILDLSKMEAGKMELHSVDFDLTETVEETLSLLSLGVSQQGLELVFLPEDDLQPHWRGDVTRLKQVLLNLVGNAVKFTKKGQVVVSVRRLGQAKGVKDGPVRLQFEVSDTGVGIPDELQQRLFEPFFQVDSSDTRRFGGTGLGLAICRQIVETVGGKLWLKSSSHEGSTFCFEFPLEPMVSLSENRVDENPIDEGGLLGKNVLGISSRLIGRTQIEKKAKKWGMRATLLEEAPEKADLRADFDFAFVNLTQADIEGLSASFYERIESWKIPVIFLAPISSTKSSIGKGLKQFRIVKKPIVSKELLHACLWAVGQSEKSKNSTLPRESQIVADDGFSDLRLLVVEDNLVNKRVVELQLKRLGCVAKFATNGEEALEQLNDGVFDLVFMDCQMPGMDGYEATRCIRKSPQFGKTFVVAMTANSMAGDREKCLEAGMDGYLGKPINIDLLHEKLVEAVVRKNGE